MSDQCQVQNKEFIHHRTRNPLLVARAVWRLVRDPGATEEATILEDVFAEGWRAGKRARPLFGMDWSTQWQRPIDDVRRDLGLPEKVASGQGILAEAA